MNRLAEVSVLRHNAVQIAPAASRAGINIDLFIEEELPSVYVDLDYMERVLNNLLDNAVKFTPDGGVIEVWSRMDFDNITNSLLIGVRDSGPGISEEVQPHLFTKYQQSDSVKGRRAGSGLGLHFCKLAIDAHGGEIWVESIQDKGSTFIVRLPMPQE